MSTYTTLGQRAAKAAHQLTADLWDYWPGDDPGSLTPIIADHLTQTARSIQVAGTKGYALVKTANNEADDYYQAMIDTPERDAADAVVGRFYIARALLSTLGCSAAELQAFASWHNALAGGTNAALFHLN